jgi:CheY-like chemotaxis protein
MKEVCQILLVEDNAADVYLLRKAIAAANFEVELTVIEDGAEALAFVRAEGKYAARGVPDLAVLDLNLPKNEGTAVLTAIRQTKDVANVPVVITSSSPSPSDRSRVELLGIERYVVKPTDLEEFLKIGAILKEVLIACKERHSSTRL